MSVLNRACGVLILFSSIVSTAQAVSPDARGTAMGGAYSAFAEGAQGMWWNPATLGAPTIGSVMIGFGIDAGNDSLNLSRIGNLMAGASDKDKAVGDIRAKDNGAGKWNAAIPAVAGIALSVKGFGIGIFPQASLSAEDVTADLLAFALYYPNYDQAAIRSSYSFGGSFKESRFTEIGIGYGREIVGLIPGVSLSAGAAIKMYLGHRYEHVTIDQTAWFPDLPAPAVITGTGAVHEKSSSGRGFGADLGVNARVATVNVSIAVKNIGGKIKWTDVKKKTGQMNAGTRDFNLTLVPNAPDVSEDVPTVVLIGVGGSVPVIGTSAGLEVEANATDSETRLRIGLEQKLFAVLALRGGYVTKAGASPAMVTFGFGLGALIASFDVGAGIATNGKGGSASMSASVSF